MKYEWRVGDHLTITVENGLICGTDGKRHAGPGLLERFIADEILRLVRENKKLRAEART